MSELLDIPWFLRDPQRQLALDEYDSIREGIELGYLCPKDATPCEFETVRVKEGEDLDGNRGWWVEYQECRKCGEPPHDD